jgi:glycosyltransferase involved in cell wall biosynthesis
LIRQDLAARQESHSPKISVVLPAYNEENQISETVRKVKSSLDGNYEYEIIIVDDGSRDGTRNEALRIADGRTVKVVAYDQNMGKGHAIKCGLKNATGDVLVFLDSDTEIDPRVLERYVLALNDAGLAIGSKRVAGSHVHVPFARRFLSFGFFVVMRLMTGLKVSDTQTGLKAGRKEALSKILPLLSVKRYAFDVEILVVAQLLHTKIVELPVDITLSARFSAKAVLRMWIDLMGITYRLRIKRWYQKNLLNSNADYEPLLKW